MVARGIEMVEWGFDKDTGHREGSWKGCHAGEMRSHTIKFKVTGIHVILRYFT